MVKEMVMMMMMMVLRKMMVVIVSKMSCTLPQCATGPSHLGTGLGEPLAALAREASGPADVEILGPRPVHVGARRGS